MRYVSLPLFIAAVLMFPAAVMAEPTPAYEGSTLAWEYPEGTQYHRGFRINVDGVTGSTQFAGDVRSTPLSGTLLNGLPFGVYTLRLVATANAPAVNSVPAVIEVDYQARPVLPTPTSTRITFEWVVPQ